METEKNLSSIEVRNLMLDTLAYEGNDIDSEGKNFKMYGYRGTQSDLFRLMEGLAIKKGIIENSIPLGGAAWVEVDLCYIHTVQLILDTKTFN